MRGFVIYPTYKVKDGKAFVHLYGKLENDESFVAIFERKAYFYIGLKDKEKAISISSNLIFEDNSNYRKNFDSEDVIKVIFDSPKVVPDERKRLQDNGIKCYEADILFAYRFLIDNDLKGSVDIEGKHFGKKEFNSMYNSDYDADRIYLNPEIKPAEEYFPKLKILSFDIETDMKASQLYSIAIYSEKYKKVLLSKKGIFSDCESYETEKEVLQRFIELVKEIDPDIITGWNIVDFDLEVLRKLCSQHKIDLKIGRDDSNIMIKLSESFYKESIAKIEGRVVLDGIALLKTSFVTLPDYKLDTAARVILGKKKLITGDERFKEITLNYQNDPQKLVDYNMLDAKLVIDILEKKDLINLTITRSKLTRMQLDRVKASIASLDSLYLKELMDRNIVAPTAYVGEGEEEIKGGYVRESKPGIYHNIMVLDFKSLYPSIIRTFNIDPHSYVPKNRLDRYSKEEIKKFITAPNGAHFRNEDGILPLIIQHLYEERVKAKKNHDELKSNAIKILMNSMYGVLANPTCRFYNTDMANAITHFGQFLIKLTADEMTKKGYDVIYGDTDSIFINVHQEKYSDAVKLGEEIAEFINVFFKKYITDNYNRESKMEIEFEKVYKKFFMPTVRGSDVGAKKRYAGIIEKNGADEIEFVGLESVRSDWTEIAKLFQLTLLSKVFNDEPVTVYIKSFLKELKSGSYDDKLIYRKAIRKPVSFYTKTTPPHIQAARKINRDDVGTIYYVMTTDGPEEIEHVTHKLDYDHYIEKQIKPIAESVLAFYNEKFEDLAKSHKQNSLLGY